MQVHKENEREPKVQTNTNAQEQQLFEDTGNTNADMVNKGPPAIQALCPICQMYESAETGVRQAKEVDLGSGIYSDPVPLGLHAHHCWTHNHTDPIPAISIKISKKANSK